MSAKYLGSHFAIHCGGEDHISVHHTNEIAQAQACYDTRLAEFWLHGAFLQLDGEKMSKSRGNVINPDDVVDAHGADALRLCVDDAPTPCFHPRRLRPRAVTGSDGAFRAGLDIVRRIDSVRVSGTKSAPVTDNRVPIDGAGELPET